MCERPSHVGFVLTWHKDNNHSRHSMGSNDNIDITIPAGVTREVNQVESIEESLDIGKVT